MNMTKSRFIIFLALAFVIFAIFRFSNIYSVPVFVDEAIYVRWSQVMKAEASLRFLPMSDGKQPLFMWATMPMFKIISDPLVAARSLSTLTGLGSMIGLVILSFLYFKNFYTALLTGLVYALVPFTVFFDRMALADSMLAMFGVWSLVFFKLFLDKRTQDFAMLTGFALGASMLTKSPAIFYFAWIVIVLLLEVDFKKENKKTILNLLLGAFYVLSISLAMKSILKLGPNSGMDSSRNLDYLYSFKEVLSHPLSPLIGNLKTTFWWLWYLLTPGLVISLFIQNIFKNKKLLLFFCLSLLPLLSQSAIAKVYTSRYILFAISPLIIIIGYNLSRLNRYLLALVLILAGIFSAKYVWLPESTKMPYDMSTGYYQEWTAGWGQKQVADYFINLTKQGKTVVAFTEGFFGTMPDGIQIYTQATPGITIVGSHPIVSEIPEGLLKTDPKNERFLIVNKSRNKLQDTDLAKLELIYEFPKHYRADGTQEVLQLLKLK